MTPDEIWDENVPLGEQIDETLRRRQEKALTERGHSGTMPLPEGSPPGSPRSVSASEKPTYRVPRELAETIFWGAFIGALGLGVIIGILATLALT